MNSYERVMTTVRGEEPDRVPIMENFISQQVMQALHPGVKGQPEFAEAFDLDSVCAMPEWKKTREDADGFVDEWGVRYKPSPEMISHPLEGPVKTRDDLLTWHPPDPQAPWRLGRLEELVAKHKGKKIIYFHHRVDFMWSVYLMGMDNLLMSFHLDPELAHEVLERVAAVNIAIARRAARAGADVVCFADDYAAGSGPLMSPAHFDEFLLARYRRAVQAVKDEGAMVMKHCDGNVIPIVDRLLSAPIDMLNPVEPVPGVREMTLEHFKSAFGNRVTLVGNIDCADLLTFRNPPDVERAVRSAIRAAGRGGRYIVSSSNSIHSSVKPENFRAMIEATKRWGSYPLAV
ncbi:MAG: uroporphyrinogen decarboxylase family protein [Planctomycetota bacterium]